MQADTMQVDDGPALKRKGRGFQSGDAETTMQDAKAEFDQLPPVDGPVAPVKGNEARSIEGYIIIVTGVHEEASEEDVQSKFDEYGVIKNLHLNLDRRTGYVKGYALVEYETKAEAQRAVDDANGSTILEQTIKVDFAFIKDPTAGNGVAPVSGRKADGRASSPSRIVRRID